MIKVYSTPTCPWCFKLKDFLQDKEIEFEDVDISKDSKGREEMFAKSNQIGVPVVDIGGVIIVGFDRIAIEEAIKNL